MDAIALCGRAVAGWHASWLNALGLRSEFGDDAWRALDAAPHIYHGAITLRREATAAAVTSAPGGVCDTWQVLDLTPHGYRLWREEPWFHRPAGAVAAETPPELEIVRVSTAAEVEEFELVSVRGFEHEGASIASGTIHPPEVLEDSRMAIFVGRVDGRPVGAATGYRTEEAVGVFGVAVVASARRRGYGSALTRAAMLPETRLPAILAPSEEGAGVYRRLGFQQVGALSIWIREDPGP